MYFRSFPRKAPGLLTELAATSPGGKERRRRRGPELATVSLLALLLASTLLAGQRDMGAARGYPVQAPRRGQGRGPLPGQRAGFFRRLRDLPPAEQERFMAENPRFRRLPPARQRLVRERLRRWNALTPEQKELFHEREGIFQGLSPAQRQEARAIFPEWRELSPDRRREVLRAFRHLRDLPPGQRQRYLASPEVQQRFSPQERHVLEGLNRLLPNSPSIPPEEPEE
jgi:hypothetical protein